MRVASARSPTPFRWFRYSRLRRSYLDPLVPVEPSADAQPLDAPVVAPEEVRPLGGRLAALVVDAHVVPW